MLVTFTCKKSLATPAKHKITKNTQYVIPANLACYMVCPISWTSKDNTKAVFFKTLPLSAKFLAHQLFELL